MHKKILLSLCLFFVYVHGMDLPVCHRDYFSEQSNIERRLFIFPLFTDKDCKTMEHVRNAILSVALVSSKSYEQMMCPLFVQDMLRVIGNIFIQSDYCVAINLRIPRIEGYAKCNTNLHQLVHENKFSPGYLSYFKNSLSSRQAHINFTCTAHNITLLMRAVYSNNGDLCKFLIQEKADHNAYAYYNNDGKKQKTYFVRDCNMIYSDTKLKKCLNFLYDHLFPNLHRQSSHTGQLDFFRRMYEAGYALPKKLYDGLCQHSPECTNTQDLYTALYIDTLLERKGAYSSFLIHHCPLYILLTQGTETRYAFVYRMILCMIFNNNVPRIKTYAPKAIARLLCEFLGPEKGRVLF